MSAHWQHFPHVADMAVRGIGSTKSEAFEQAALAMTAVITDPSSVHARDMVQIECQASDDELLLVDWLNDLIYHKMLFSRFSVQLDDGRLHGRAWGEAIRIDFVGEQAAVSVLRPDEIFSVRRHQPAESRQGYTQMVGP
jgi:SHS2 domain-containing protein